MTVHVRWLRENQIIEAIYEGDHSVEDSIYACETFSQMLQAAADHPIHILIDTEKIGKVTFTPSDLFNPTVTGFFRRPNLVSIYAFGVSKNHLTFFSVLVSVVKHIGVSKSIKIFPTRQEALAEIESQLE
ncbi:MAG: hypothetical protein ACOYL5_04350 [Phototrophicaceae bacterium]